MRDITSQGSVLVNCEGWGYAQNRTASTSVDTSQSDGPLSPRWASVETSCCSTQKCRAPTETKEGKPSGKRPKKRRFKGNQFMKVCPHTNVAERRDTEKFGLKINKNVCVSLAERDNRRIFTSRMRSLASSFETRRAKKNEKD
ncbi:hypothetical protein TNIN_380151 [Trichonephila inaurata madagascariensis]|uniref:Uncharacterized protein n=1 Tax=Trichonephila inaurata madagascariensis TaxID=2747483 RepID=A0A8X6YT00_9ARAC|nr:hypothetical protein TNIN_380151 [Trichonephila inaurata madagascariensis]